MAATRVTARGSSEVISRMVTPPERRHCLPISVGRPIAATALFPGSRRRRSARPSSGGGGWGVGGGGVLFCAHDEEAQHGQPLSEHGWESGVEGPPPAFREEQAR